MAEGVDLAAVAQDSSEMSREEMEALMSPPEEAEPTPEQQGRAELEAACAGGLRIITIPAIIEIKDGRKFRVDDFRAWGWTPFGVFGIGKFEDEAPEQERQMQFNGDEIKSIELQFDLYNEAAEAAEVEQQSEEQSD